MSSTPTNPRTYNANTNLTLKITPLNSPYNRSSSSARSPSKLRNLFESGLSLAKVIGTTASSPNGFDVITSAGIFAYTAGATAVVVNVDEELRPTQRFYRARPTASPQNATSVLTYSPSPPTAQPNESRNRTVTSLRESAIAYSPSRTTEPQGDWGDSPSSKTWTSRERIKATTCLSLSPDGRYLAVGEAGYAPRVMIFSLHDGSSNIPIAILGEHTFGVRACAFSPDSRYLASLGLMNDGFLYVWSISGRNGSATLHSSNKCTSAVKAMIWMGSCVIT